MFERNRVCRCERVGEKCDNIKVKEFEKKGVKEQRLQRESVKRENNKTDIKGVRKMDRRREEE